MFNEQSRTRGVQQDILVDALDEGVIVRVPESYARREGLPILRKWVPPQPEHKSPNKLGSKEIGGMDAFRRPLRKESEGVRAALFDNFHWALRHRRQQMSLSRKQLAVAVGASEQDIKFLENGVLPSNDFVLISTLESYCGITLRKEPAASAPPTNTLRPARSMLTGMSAQLFGSGNDSESSVRKHSGKELTEKKEQDLLNSEDLLGDAIELDDSSKAL